MVSQVRARSAAKAAGSSVLVLVLLAGCGGALVGQNDPEPTLAPAPSRAPTLAPTVASISPTRPVVVLADEADAEDAASPVAQAAVPPVAGGAPAATGMTPVEVVQRVSPSVVTVVNERQAGGFGGGQALEAGRGTGFIIDDAGHIVTNEHVVRGGDQFEVLFADGEKRQAELIGADRLSDLAVVQVSGEVPGTVPFGDSSALQVGQPVLAIGSPLGEFTNTVTDGIVSSLGRDLGGGGGQGETAYSNLIQHNAAINPGNSGGPLFDLAGQVIGVNTLGLQQTQGLFFAIPANTVAQIAGQLIENRRVAYPFLGVARIDINPQLASQADLPIDYGAYIDRVDPGTPADQAGLEQGDVIVGIGDSRIDERTSFSEALFAHRPGETVPLTVMRGSDEVTLDVTLGERPDRP